MRRLFFLCMYIMLFFMSYMLAHAVNQNVSPTVTIVLQPDEVQEILTAHESYVTFNELFGLTSHDILAMSELVAKYHFHAEDLLCLTARVIAGKTTAPLSLVIIALSEMQTCLEQYAQEDANRDYLLQAIDTYYRNICDGNVLIHATQEEGENIILDEKVRTGYKKFYNVLVHDKLSCGSLFVAGNVTIGGNLTIGGRLIVHNLQVSGSIELIGNPQQACIIFRDAALIEKARICSSPIPGDKGVFVSVDSGITQNLRVTNAGNVAIPSASITASGTTGQILLGSQTPALAVQLYTVDNTRNLFAGNYTTANTTVAGTDNVSIGTNANATLTTQNNVIAIGNSASALATDAIAIGDAANSAQPRTIVIGSRDSTSTGLAPTAGAANAIAIGSASDGINGANAGGIAAVAIGGSGGIFPGASASGSRSIAIGVNATSSGSTSITLGSASGTAGGNGPQATNSGAVAIGSANGTMAGPVASGLASLALGSADSAFPGAAMSGDRSIGIGVNANSAQPLTIVIGSASGTAGGSAPTAGATNAIAIGSGNATMPGASAAGPSSVAIGGATTTISGAITNANADSSVAIGTGATTSTASTIAIGTRTSASNTNALAIGGATIANVGASSSGVSSIAIGGADVNNVGAIASGARSIALGTGVTSSNASSVAIGAADGAGTVGAISSGIASIAIGGSDGSFNGANMSGDRSIGIGVNANSAQPLTIVIGGASGTVGGNAPTATAANAIVIGSAQGAMAGPSAAGSSAIAIGSALGSLTGAVADTANSIAIGINARTTTNANGIAIGSGQAATRPGAIASGLAAVAIGGADNAGTRSGASATGTRSVAIGCGATTAQNDAIVLGDATLTAVRVGIGIAAPTAKLHVIGVNGTRILLMDQVNNAITNAPTWLNPSTSAAAGTPIHYDGANRLFGFTSSRRYKENIRSIDTESEIIYRLNPVLYDAKKGHGEGKNIAGFIAEEVYEAAPNLAILNGNHEPENVAYNSLHALVIKEMQKQHCVIEEQKKQLDDRATKIKTLLECMHHLQERIESLEQQV